MNRIVCYLQGCPKYSVASRWLQYFSWHLQMHWITRCSEVLTTILKWYFWRVFSFSNSCWQEGNRRPTRNFTKQVALNHSNEINFILLLAAFNHCHRLMFQISYETLTEFYLEQIKHFAVFAMIAMFSWNQIIW